MLETIDCPVDFRGFQKVHAVIDYFLDTHPTLFEIIFDLDTFTASRALALFSDIDSAYYENYQNPKPARGWMSRRPLYSLLFVFYDRQDQQTASALLFFLKHYYENESKIIMENRTEDSIRAFRLLYTDETIDRSCFNALSITEITNNIRNFRDTLKEEDNIDDESSASSRIGYLRNLEHFYLLDWKKRTSFTRTSQKIIRSSFSRRKIERVVGSDNLYTASLNKRTLSQPLTEAGVSADEDYPELCIIKTEQPIHPKPKYELPDFSVIKDRAKIQNKNRVISKDVRRSHNITPLSRNILQPHELCILWHSLNTKSNNAIQTVPKNNIKLLLHIILLTGRDLNAVCNLSIDYNESNENASIIIKNSRLVLKIAPKPTAELGKHSNNENLLKTKKVAFIYLPCYLFDIYKQSRLDRYPTLAGKYKVNICRKAIESYIKKLNQRYHCQISLKRIENHLTNRMIAVEQHDPVILEMLRGELSYYSRSPRHYAWYSESEINCYVQALWSDTFEQIKQYKPDFSTPVVGDILLDIDSRGIGSQFTPKATSLHRWVSNHINELNQLSAFDVSKNLQNLVEYHNRYAVYTLLMLINASGYRAVYNPLPSFDLLLIRYKALCISDKDSSKTFSHTRVIACPTLLQFQLKHYQQHAIALANLINHLYPAQSRQLYAQTCDHQLIDLTHKNDRIEWFLSAKNSRSNDGLFFLFLQDSDDKSFYRTKNSGPKILSEYINLPLNFGRHYVRRYLELSNVHQELIKFQLGHWVNGETPLEKCSSLNHREAIEHLLPILNQMMEELDWKAIPSLITRKRA
ncbi:hypothetical protein [Vibrio viridaestus]|uniref:hypothetical protein n=1 Tax=Vibrio viridaestus TaxID=2487322 RepID=UPI000F611869|nr:hypothetical protein [Vibrio viridaestus]